MEMTPSEPPKDKPGQVGRVGHHGAHAPENLSTSPVSLPASAGSARVEPVPVAEQSAQMLDETVLDESWWDEQQVADPEPDPVQAVAVPSSALKEAHKLTRKMTGRS